MRIFYLLMLCIMLLTVPSCIAPTSCPYHTTHQRPAYQKVIIKEPVEEPFIIAYQQWIILGAYILSYIFMAAYAKHTGKQHPTAKKVADNLYKGSKGKFRGFIRIFRFLAGFFTFFIRRKK